MSAPLDGPQVEWRPRWAVIVAAIMGLVYAVGVVCTLAWMVMFSDRIFPLALWLIGSPTLVAGIAGMLVVVSFVRRGRALPVPLGHVGDPARRTRRLGHGQEPHGSVGLLGVPASQS